MAICARRVRAGVTLSVLLASLLGGTTAGAEAAVPDDAAFALLQALNAELLRNESATATLQHWCAEHHIAAAERITAVQLPTAPVPPAPAQRALLQVGDAEPVRFRHVQLRCGPVVLADAENWYVPARLSEAMNRELDATDTPFGVVVHDLGFHRRRLEARLLWSPTQPMPEAVLLHRALLVRADGLPFSLVQETYLRSTVLPERAP
jgi:chorismate-pyruvate lyase